MGGPLEQVGAKTPVDQSQTPKAKVDKKAVTHEGRSWIQRKADKISEFFKKFIPKSWRKEPAAPLAKRKSVVILDTKSSAKDLSKTEEKSPPEKGKEKLAKEEVSTSEKDNEKTAIAEDDASNKKTPIENKIDEISSAAGHAVGTVVERTVHGAATLGLGVLSIPAKVAQTVIEKNEPKEDKAKLEHIILSATVDAKSDEGQTLRALKEIRSTENEHQLKVKAHKEIIDGLVKAIKHTPDSLSTLTAKQKKSLTDFKKDFDVYNAKVNAFHKQLEETFASVDENKVDLTEIATKMKGAFESKDFKELHAAGAKIETQDLLSITNNVQVIKFAESHFKNYKFYDSEGKEVKQEFNPTRFPPQRMPRYEILIKAVRENAFKLIKEEGDPVRKVIEDTYNIPKQYLGITNKARQEASFRDSIKDPKAASKKLREAYAFSLFQNDYKQHFDNLSKEDQAKVNKLLNDVIKYHVKANEKEIPKLLSELKKKKDVTYNKGQVETKLKELDTYLKKNKIGNGKKIEKWEKEYKKMHPDSKLDLKSS